jgi:N-acetylglucosamine-6-phosphate deacetylase
MGEVGMTRTVLRGRVVTPEGILEDAVVVCEDGTIVDVTQKTAQYPDATLVAGYIAPGYVDVHIHGIAGADTMDAKASSLETMAHQLVKHGVTAFLPTTMTQSQEDITAALRQVRTYMEMERNSPSTGAEVIGVHLEGPWISHQAKGAQNGAFIAPPSAEYVRHILDEAGDILRIVTLAPELEGADAAIEQLRNAKVEVSIGHTTANYAEAMHAITLGARHVTHCFNAMTGMHHRDPGVVGAAFQDCVFAELIADGVHVHPEVMKALVKIKGRERVMLISDSMAAADMPDGTYALGGQTTLVRDGQARLPDGTLAGSTLTLDRAVQNMVNLCGVPIEDAIYMASTTPAEAIGLGDKKGKIQIGFDADIVVLDEALRPVQTFLATQQRLGSVS